MNFFEYFIPYSDLKQKVASVEEFWSLGFPGNVWKDSSKIYEVSLELAILKLTIVDHLHIACRADILLGWVNLQACNHLFDWPCFIQS